jgi:hypothetical protein
MSRGARTGLFRLQRTGWSLPPLEAVTRRQSVAASDLAIALCS